MATLAHTQVRQLGIIQVADLFGAYTISFIMVFVAAGVLTMLPSAQRRRQLWPALPVLLVVIPATRKVPVSQRALCMEQQDSRGLDARLHGSAFRDRPDRPRQTLEQYGELTYGRVRFPPDWSLARVDVSTDGHTEDPGVEPNRTFDRLHDDRRHRWFDRLLHMAVVNQPENANR
jgi:hypothetical protein